MSEIADLITEMVKRGVDADLIGKTAEILASKRPMSNAERQSKHRENKKELPARNESNESVTPVTSENKEKEQRTKKEKETPSPKENPPTGVKRKGSPPARGSRLPPDWELPKDWGEWALQQGLPTDRVLLEEEKFRDYWHARAGPNGVKLDWKAVWRNWVRRTEDFEK